jgi:putative hemolysin
LTERGSYQTLGGFVITHLGRIPAAADHFQWQGMRFEVMDMDGNRVDKVLVVPTEDKLPDSTNKN